MRKYFIAATILVMVMVVLTGCSGGSTKDDSSLIKDAASNFDIIISNNVENSVYHNELRHFGIQLKDGDKFEWAEDTSVSDADFSISVNADDFIKAGLDVTKLNESQFAYKEASGNEPNVIIYTYDVSDKEETYKDYIEAFEKLMGQIPEQIAVLENDGYILNLDQGFQVHWNGDQRLNKDIALIISADDLIKAGLKVDKLNEWRVMKNADTTDMQVKLLKIYYLK